MNQGHGSISVTYVMFTDASGTDRTVSGSMLPSTCAQSSTLVGRTKVVSAATTGR